MKKCAVATLLLLIAFACDDKDNVAPGKTSLLRLTVDASYATDDTDNWIIVHGEDGSLLASQSFETNDELEIVTNKAARGKITVTHLRYFMQNGKKYYYGNSHSNIEKGKHMVLQLASTTSPGTTGKFSVSVSNVGFVDHQALSNRAGSTGTSAWSGGTDIISFQPNTYTGISKHIVTVSDGNFLRHKILSNVKPNDSYSFSLYDMDPFDQTVDFTFPQSDAIVLYVSGSEPDATLAHNNYNLISHSNSDMHTTIEAGYLNSLTNYKTRLYIHYAEYSYEYINIGAIPNGNFVWPQKADFNIGEKTFNNYSATTPKPYIWRLSRWSQADASGQTIISWDVSSSSGNQSIQELPTEITSAHPTLSFSNMKHTSTTFYTESPAFESVVNSYFQTSAEPAGLRLGIKIITK